MSPAAATTVSTFTTATAKATLAVLLVLLLPLLPPRAPLRVLLTRNVFEMLFFCTEAAHDIRCV